MKINYDILALILQDMKTLDHVTIKTLNDINGNHKKLIVYGDHTFKSGHPAMSSSNILFSEVSARSINMLKTELLSHGFTERKAGEN